MQGSKSLNKKRALTHCLAPIKVLKLVFVRRRKKRNRKIVETKYRPFFVSGDRLKKRTANKDVFCVERF